MAAQTGQQTYSDEDRNLTRLTCIHHKVATEVLRFIFTCGSSSRPHDMPLLDYYSSKGINANKFRKRLFDEQKRKIAADPQGASFDITLLYRCLRTGSHGLAAGNDEKWDKDDKASIESLISIVKNKRNNLAHDQPMYTIRQLIDEANGLKEDLVQILKLSGQIYPIPTSQVDQEIANVEAHSIKYLYDDFEPKTFEEYKNQLFFDAQSEFLNDEGRKDTLKQYKKCFEEEVSTTNHLIDLSLPVDLVYTDMALKSESGSGRDESIKYEDVLLDESQNKTSSVIVINGPAGVGKTTLTKKMILDFVMMISTMKGLITHDHLLKAECRNTFVESFVQLLYHLMPNISNIFKAGDLVKVTLAQKVLVILDGLDELNKASAQLFEELLSLQKLHGITLIITTRPEKMKYIEERLKYHQIKMKHIQLLGVPTEKKEEFVKKYHLEMTKKYQCNFDINGLLKYLKQTKHRLADVWRLPYNLTLLTIIWAYSFMNVASIKTAPELYREILRLCRTKLKERLQFCESTRHLHESELQKKIDLFLCSLAREALLGLINDQINLTQDAYERLAKVCSNIKIPVEEMISAFLKRVPSADIIYSFPHKGLQDFLAAHYIWLQITGRNQRQSDQHVLEGTAAFLQENADPNVSEKTLRYLETVLKKQPTKNNTWLSGAFSGILGSVFTNFKASSFIHDTLDEVHSSSKHDLSKFQNMLICLLGMFYSERDVIDDDIKLEALMLLQETGIRDSHAWISILNSVKCDKYVASFISKQPKILDGHIQITDTSVSAYISLTKALNPPLKNAHKVTVDIDITGDLSDAYELLQLISSHQFKVMKILITHENLKDYVVMLKTLNTPLRDAHDVKIDICNIMELSDIWELMNLIKENHFTIRTLQVREFEINDTNFRDYISGFKSLPHLQENANKTCVDINIKGDLTGADELLGLINNCQFKLKSILISESNFMQYTTMLKTLTQSFKVKIDICIDQDTDNVRKLMREIVRNRFDIRKFQVRNIKIDDSNQYDCLSILEASSIQWQENKPNVYILVIDYLDWEILKLIGIHKLKVKVILITNRNFRQYESELKYLNVPLKEAHEVNIDMQVKEKLPKIKQLVKHIRERGFTIRTLELKGKDMKVTDRNLRVYTEALGTLPILEKDVYRGKIHVIIRNETSDISALLREIARNKIPVNIRLYHDFRHPSSPSVASEEALNRVFTSCLIEKYLGKMQPHLSIPVSLKRLVVSIPDTTSYLQLQRFLETNHQLEYLRISIDLDLEIENISPLPGNLKHLPSLFLPDINTRECAQKGYEIAKRLCPINGHKMFKHMYFPRLGLLEEEIEILLSEMNGVKIKDYVVLPSYCRPPTKDVEQKLQELAKRTLGCSIRWRYWNFGPDDLKNVTSSSEDNHLNDIDSWGYNFSRRLFIKMHGAHLHNWRQEQFQVRHINFGRIDIGPLL